MQVTMYTTHCPRCRVLDLKLKEKKIAYEEVSDIDEIRSLGILSVPYLKVDDKLYNFTEAIKWVGEQE